MRAETTKKTFRFEVACYSCVNKLWSIFTNHIYLLRSGESLQNELNTRIKSFPKCCFSVRVTRGEDGELGSGRMVHPTILCYKNHGRNMISCDFETRENRPELLTLIAVISYLRRRKPLFPRGNCFST